nr:uncharacterized protein LOC111427534 [Onthophagus taurus]
MERKEKLFLSENILFEDDFLNGGVLVDFNGKIKNILSKCDIERNDYLQNSSIQIFDFDSKVLMPGIIDTHVHINEPGRTDWEGFETATKAAAAGGITTIIDMPLNSIPPTTTLKNLKTKLDAAKNQIWVDVGFWGGVVPGNENELLNMIKAGVVGFKCFLTPSGVDEFEYVRKEDVEKTIKILENTGSVLAFHAEFEENDICEGDPTKYETFLKTRPEKMEEHAIKFIVDLSRRYNTKLHIVHLSTATCLETIQKAKLKGNLTVETCHHYLTFNSENIPDKATEYKCCPPIRTKENKEKLWIIGLGDDIIDMVVSDHSPSTPDLKKGGNFLTAWGGISSLQFGLSLFWTELNKRNKKIFEISKYMSQNTSKLVGLHNKKGKINVGFDADFVIWDPNDFITIVEEQIFHKNKITPYLGMKLKGKVFATVVRGEIVYKDGIFCDTKIGKLLINEKIFGEI